MASPSVVQDRNTRDVPLSLFSGTNNEMSPVDVPEGVSPDNQDVAFLPGSVFSRPCLRKIFTAPLSGSPTMMYMKTFLKQDGTPVNLYLDGGGHLWQEDVFSTPGTVASVGTVVPGSYGKSVTIDGVEYIAFSDGEQGTDIPRQYNGINFDRISQDGPGAGPTVSNYAIPPLALNASGAGGAIVITSITPTDPISVLVGYEDA
jgi:hypothetical protein